MALALPKSRLLETQNNSTIAWQADLKNLFHHAKERYADVVWELVIEGESGFEEVWGHKAIVYARAPLAFQANYFSFRPPPVASPNLFSPSPGIDQSTDTLLLENRLDRPETPYSAYDLPRDGSPTSRATHAANAPSGLLRLHTSLNPALFSNELEYLYTAQGLGVAFEFLFDSQDRWETPGESEPEETRQDKLRKDLAYMWRSRLFSDVRIALTGAKVSPPEGASPSDNDQDTAVVFFSHRFILVSRSPYFHGVLQSSFSPPSAPTDGTLLTLELPPASFTPASLHWALGYMYTGTLNFSNRTFDLDTAFAIVRSAAFLQLPQMSAEVEAFIVDEMLHGFFHAYLTFEEYDRITAGKWGVGGCRCRQCQRRAPRVLEFSIAPDIENKVLERGARRALVGMFGEGWCISEFASLSTKIRASLLKGVTYRTTPQNIFPLLFAAYTALKKLDGLKEIWVETIRDMVDRALKKIEEVFCENAEACFEQGEWLEIMDADGGRSDDTEKVGWTMTTVKNGLKESNAALVYQVLVSSILLRPHPTEVSETLLPNNSPIRVSVEETRVEVVKWLRKNWVTVRLASGFDALEPWSVKEISHELEVNVTDLLSPSGSSNVPKTAAKRNGQPSPREKDPEMEAMSTLASSTTTSLRGNVLNRNMAKSNVLDTNGNRTTKPAIAKQNGEPSPKPVRSVKAPVKTNASSVSSKPSIISAANAEKAEQASIVSDNTSYLSSPGASSADLTPAPTTPKLLGATFGRSNTIGSVASSTNSLNLPPSSQGHEQKTVASRRGVLANTTSAQDSPASARPKSIAASVNSVKSTTSTIRRGASATATTKSPTSPGVTRGTAATNGRKISNASNTGGVTPRVSVISTTSRPSSRTSVASSTFKSAHSELEVPPLPRTRTVSMTSGISTRSTGTEVNSRAGKVRGNTNLAVSSPKPLRARKTSDASMASVASNLNRPSSQTSMRSTVSTKTADRKKTVGSVKKPAEKIPDVPKRPAALVATTSKPKVPTIKTIHGAKGKEPVKESSPQTPPIVVAPPLSENDSPSSSSPIKQAIVVSSSVSTNSEGGSTIRLTMKKSNDTITRAFHTDADSDTGGSTLRPKDALKLMGTTSPTKPSAADVLTPPFTTPLTTPSPIAQPIFVPPTPAPSHPPVVAQPVRPPLPPPDLSSLPHGMTLNVGIPCIITSKRTRFRAFARYLGEVYGESGPWVGVEVPTSELPALDRVEGRDWHDGSWGGVRYFDIRGSEWEEEGRATKRRRMDPMYSSASRKRDGDLLSLETRSSKRWRSVSPAISDASNYENRGLFVRPQQVLYVVDARA